MKPTHVSTLAVALLTGGVTGWVILLLSYDDLPQLPTGWAVVVGVIAILVAFLAWTTRNRLKGEHGARPPEPLTIARYAALAKACSPVGAGVAGLWLGFLVYLLSQHGSMAVRHDRWVSIAGVVTGVALAAAALWLEWVCRIRVDHDGKPPRGGVHAGA